MQKTRRKIILAILSAVFVIGSVVTVSNASPAHSANFDLIYTNSPYGNTTYVQRDIYSSGAGYKVNVTQLSGTSTNRKLRVKCDDTVEGQYEFTATGTKNFTYSVPSGSYVTFKLYLIYTANTGSARAKGTVSQK